MRKNKIKTFLLIGSLVFKEIGVLLYIVSCPYP